LVNKNDHKNLLDTSKHLSVSNGKSNNHFYFRENIVHENLLVVKNLNYKNSTHVKIYAYPYYSSHNFWGPGNGGFWLAIITFTIGFTLCTLTYINYKRQLVTQSNSQYYLIATASGGSVTNEKN